MRAELASARMLAATRRAASVRQVIRQGGTQPWRGRDRSRHSSTAGSSGRRLGYGEDTSAAARVQAGRVREQQHGEGPGGGGRISARSGGQAQVHLAGAGNDTGVPS
jgi:hypothetical protein